MLPLTISAYTLTSALGGGREASAAALRGIVSPLRVREAWELPLPVGEVEDISAAVLPAALARFDCRNNRLAELALAQDDFEAAVSAARARHGGARIGVFAGTSTSGILETERAFRRMSAADAVLAGDFPYASTHRICALAEFLQARLDLAGPAMSMSTACSSSARAFASAARHIRLGLCDAAVIAGVDSLCLTTLYGFQALQLTASAPCRPFSADRAGLNIGEGAGFALLEPGHGGLILRGYGESADAHHMSTPHPQAAGARLAIRRALASADLAPEAIDYVNLHGTATPLNDATEDLAVRAELGSVPCSATKGWTGHTLGAAGIIEALITALALECGRLPGTLNTSERDPALGVNLFTQERASGARRALSNSFGFGGNNCTLVLEQEG